MCWVNLMVEEGIEFVIGVVVGIDVIFVELWEEYDFIVFVIGVGNVCDILFVGCDVVGIYFVVLYLL